MNFLKKLLAFIFKFILVIIIIVVVIALGLFIYYLVTIEAAEEYIPDDFALYVKVDSVREIYDNVIDLKAADVIFSTPDLKSIYGAILEFKSNEISQNIFFRQLLEVKAYFVIDEDYSPTIIFDPGILSLATRMFPILNLFYRMEDLDLNIIQKGAITIYNFKPAPEQDFYFCLNNNLIFLSTKQENIEKLYECKQNQNNIKNNEAISVLSEKIKQKGFIELYISTNSVIENALMGIPELDFLLEDISLNAFSILSFFVSNNELHLNAYTNVDVKDDTLREFLKYNPSLLGVIKYLPQQTNIYTSVNFKTFKHIYEVALYLKGDEIGDTIKQIEDACELLFGIGVQELFFDWVGSEAGAFTLADSVDPIIFLNIKDKAKFDYAMQKLDESLFLDQDQSLVLDDVRIYKISFPPFVKMIVDAFVKGLDTPYYITIDDYIFFCMNAENLANFSQSYRSKELLIRTDSYKEVTKDFPKNANIFMYYNLTQAIPKFLGNNTLLNKLLGLYENGVFSVHFSDKEIKINIAASGIAGDKTISYPGFPLELENAANSDIVCKNILGSRADEVLYVDNKDKLNIVELFGDTKLSAPVEKMSSILLKEIPPTGKQDIFVFAKAGTLYKFNEQGLPVDPFPRITTFKNSFDPVEVEGKLLFYSQSEKALFLVSTDGEEERLPIEVPNHILSPPAYLDDLLAFYPKSFAGTVWLTALDGVIQEGWPQEGGGYSLCSPLLFQDKAENILVTFLTQAGILNLWGIEGNNIGDFPIQLEGVYYTNPLVISYGRNFNPCLLTLSEEGLLSLINLQGITLKAKKIDGAGNKKNKLVNFDFDRDGTDEIFIYGATNNIIGLDIKFIPLPGFPVTGSSRPYFTDLNYDRKYELVVGSFDGNLYAYTLNK